MPKRKSLSTALISFMSVLVISLVVWLVLIFLSVTSGIEKGWLEKLTALHAPIRISPKPDYYNSYYYQIDSLAQNSSYTLKTIGEKAESAQTDPFSIDLDAEIPSHLPPFDGIDPVKKAYHLLKEMDLTFQDYEIGGALLRLHKKEGSVLSQMSYLLSFPDKNPKFKNLIVDSIEKKGGGNPIMLPKNYKDHGICLGDRGVLQYAATSPLSSQEHRIPIVVQAFYDPGLVSLGNKCVIVPNSVTRTIHAATETFSPDGTPTNGIFVWISNLDQVEKIQKQIQQTFEKEGIAKYWQVSTFRDFEFAKDLLMQFQSDRTLFLLIAAIILIVACSNIISLLVLLVNDKKKEIAILQAMGASMKSVALIFGTCGAFMGALSCCIGSCLAIFTLKHLDSLVALLSAIQGHQAFNPAYFGNSLPNELSTQALLFVFIVTPILSILAGLIPAIKAAKIKPANVLRAE